MKRTRFVWLFLAILSGSIYSEARAGIEEDGKALVTGEGRNLTLKRSVKEDLIEILEDRMPTIQLGSESYTLFNFKGYRSVTRDGGGGQGSSTDEYQFNKKNLIQMLNDPKVHWDSRLKADGKWRRKLHLGTGRMVDGCDYESVGVDLVFERE